MMERHRCEAAVVDEASAGVDRVDNAVMVRDALGRNFDEAVQRDSDARGFHRPARLEEGRGDHHLECLRCRLRRRRAR